MFLSTILTSFLSILSTDVSAQSEEMILDKPLYLPLLDFGEEIWSEAEQVRLVQGQDLLDTPAVSGPWHRRPHPRAGLGESAVLVCRPEEPGSLRLRFRGTRLTLYGARYRSCGQVRWSLNDGEQSGVADGYLGTDGVFQDVLIHIESLPDQEHVFELATMTEGYQKHSPWWHQWEFWVDYIEVDGHIYVLDAPEVHLVECDMYSGGGALKIPPGKHWETSFKGDHFSIEVLHGPDESSLYYSIDGDRRELVLYAETRKIKPVVLASSLDRGAEGDSVTHRVRIEAGDTPCIIDRVGIRNRKYAAFHTFPVTVPAIPDSFQIAAIIIERALYQGNRIRTQVLDHAGNVVAETDATHLPVLGKEISSLRFLLERGQSPRSPALHQVHVIQIPSEDKDIPNPPLVGGSPNAHIDAKEAIRLGLGNVIWQEKPYLFPIRAWHDDPKTDIFLSAGLFRRAGVPFLLSMRRGLGDFVRPVEVVHHWIQDTMPDIYTPDEINTLRTIGGDFLLGLLMEEMDISMVQGGMRDESMEEFPELHDFTNRRDGRLAYENEIRKYVERYRSMGLPSLVNCGVTYHIASYRAGADWVIAELQCHMVSNAMQLALLRGGSHQFSKPFASWISLWYKIRIPCEDRDMLIWPDMFCVGEPDEGYSVSEMRRSLLASLFSGSEITVVQDPIPMFIDPNRDGQFELSSWGKALREVQQLAEKTGPVQPVKTVALLLDKDGGWSPPNLWDGFTSWTHDVYKHGHPAGHIWGKLHPGRPEAVLRDIFELLYPGSMRSGLDKYPGTFTDSPFGPVDVIESDISLEKLQAYQTVIAAGYLQIDDSLLDVLKDYVRDGGTLFMNAGQIIKNDTGRDLPGGRIVELGPSSVCIHAEPDEDSKHLSIRLHHFVPENARVLLLCDNGKPLLVENQYGDGRVILSLTDYDVATIPGHSIGLDIPDAQDLQILPHIQAIVGDLVLRANEVHVRVDWKPGLEYLPFRFADGKKGVLILNHSTTTVQTNISWPGRQVKPVVDMLTHTYYDSDGEKVPVEVLPEDAMVLCL